MFTTTHREFKSMETKTLMILDSDKPESQRSLHSLVPALSLYYRCYHVGVQYLRDIQTLSERHQHFAILRCSMYEVPSMTGVLVLCMLGGFLRKQQLCNAGGNECILVMGSCKKYCTAS